MTADEITALSARALSQAIHARRVSAREVMQATLARIDALNPVLNAIVSLRDTEALLAEADTLDAELAAGRSRGWMHGMPQAIKDLAMTAGLRTTMGSPVFSRQVPAEDSLHVARMRSAGAIVIGKTNVPEFGLGSHTTNPLFGPTLNPYDTARSAGGSSGGAAAAIAARIFAVADGSDMMGSLRNPAAFNNVIGMRPSYGRVPSGPAPDLFMDTMATDGPMARDVDDLAMLLSIQAGYDPRAPQSLDGDGSIFAGPLAPRVQGIRIGSLDDLDGYLPFEDGILDLVGNGLTRLVELGAQVEETGPGFAPERIWQSWCDLRSWRVAAKLGALYDAPATRDKLKPAAIWEIERGRALSQAEIEDASAARSAWYRAVLRLFERYDYLVAPSAQLFPFDVTLDWPKDIGGRSMDTYHRWMETVVGVSLLGLPAVSVPAGFNAAGLPTGFQIIGRPRDDVGVLQVAKAYDQATGWTAKAPPMAIGGG
ncbi:amidase [Stappia stellulata]|uniref:amidase n=1 Tax=Stappia stellulata TaxID=71235 RepID=UPI0004280F50|nr:amidase [Stappia stellulata]